LFGESPDRIARAPGRVNLLGEHVDYNNGFVIPAAINLSAYIAFSPSSKNYSTILAADLNRKVSFTSKSVQVKCNDDNEPLRDWELYVAGVMKSIIDTLEGAKPINAVFASDIPAGAGLSSSAAIELAFMTAWDDLSNLHLAPMEKAFICQKAETEYVGVNCGIMDQFASACGLKDHILFLDCQSLEWESINMPDRVSIVIADTTIRRKLSASEYNQRRLDCEKLSKY